MFLLILISLSNSALICDEISEQQDCLDIVNGIHECIWYNNECKQKNCELIQPPCEDYSYNGKNCITEGTQCISVDECQQIKNKKSCETSKILGNNCYYDNNNNKCRNKICEDNSKDECINTNQENCIYYEGICQSQEKILCENIKNEKDCSILNCFWNEQNSCQQQSCNQINSQSECISSIKNNEHCFDSSLDSQLTKCLSCSLLTDKCNCDTYELFGCQWIDQSCKEINCNMIMEENDCLNLVGCTWHYPLQKCLKGFQANDYLRECDIYAEQQILILSIILYLLY